MLALAPVSLHGAAGPGQPCAAAGDLHQKNTQPAPLVSRSPLGLAGRPRENWVIRGVLESKRFLFVADLLLKAPQQVCRGGAREGCPLSQGRVRLSRAPTNSLQEWGSPLGLRSLLPSMLWRCPGVAGAGLRRGRRPWAAALRGRGWWQPWPQPWLPESEERAKPWTDGRAHSPICFCSPVGEGTGWDGTCRGLTAPRW